MSSATASSSIADLRANSPGTAPGPRIEVGVPMWRLALGPTLHRAGWGTLYMCGVASPDKLST